MFFCLISDSSNSLSYTFFFVNYFFHLFFKSFFINFFSIRFFDCPLILLHPFYLCKLFVLFFYIFFIFYHLYLSCDLKIFSLIISLHKSHKKAMSRKSKHRLFFIHLIFFYLKLHQKFLPQIRQMIQILGLVFHIDGKLLIHLHIRFHQ